jgi:membrane-bound lytic murein transglycosylase D
MPLDLLYLAMIESGFNPVATSHASAVGIWQFMGRRAGSTAWPSTGRWMSGATRSARRTPRWTTCSTCTAASARGTSPRRRTTRARAGSSRIMRQQFGRERARSEQDYYRIWSRLPAETRDYVPLMIAAARITKDPAAYGFAPMQLRPRSGTRSRCRQPRRST